MKPLNLKEKKTEFQELGPNPLDFLMGWTLCEKNPIDFKKTCILLILKLICLLTTNGNDTFSIVLNNIDSFIIHTCILITIY